MMFRVLGAHRERLRAMQFQFQLCSVRALCYGHILRLRDQGIHTVLQRSHRCGFSRPHAISWQCRQAWLRIVMIAVRANTPAFCAMGLCSPREVACARDRRVRRRTRADRCAVDARPPQTAHVCVRAHARPCCDYIARSCALSICPLTQADGECHSRLRRARMRTARGAGSSCCGSMPLRGGATTIPAEATAQVAGRSRCIVPTGIAARRHARPTACNAVCVATCSHGCARRPWHGAGEMVRTPLAAFRTITHAAACRACAPGHTHHWSPAHQHRPSRNAPPS